MFCACKRLCEISPLQGREGRIPLRERRSVDPVDIMGEADRKRLTAGVLRAVALLDEVPGGPGLKGRAVGAHVVGEPVVAIPEYFGVLLRRGEEVPDLRVLTEDVVHAHD